VLLYDFVQEMLSPSSAQEATASVKSDAADEPLEDTDKPKLKMGLIENVRKLWDSVRMTVFVIGTALTVFVAARNTITWYVSRICDSAYKVPKCVCVVYYFGCDYTSGTRHITPLSTLSTLGSHISTLSLQLN